MMSDVSVVIPCKNLGDYLYSSTASALAQSAWHRDLACEVIIVDDGSTDKKTRSILTELSNKKRIRVLENSHPPGTSGARNAGVEAAQSPWISFLDGDDLLLPGALAQRLEVTASFPEARWVGTDFYQLHSDGSVATEGFYASKELSAAVLTEVGADREPRLLPRPIKLFLRVQIAWTGAVMVRRDLHQEVGGFDTRIGRGQDVHFWLRLAGETDYLFLPEPTALYRHRPGSVTNSGGPPCDAKLNVFQHLIEDGIFSRWSPRVRRRLHDFHLANVFHYREQGEFEGARRHALQAVQTSPWSTKAWRQTVASAMRRL